MPSSLALIASRINMAMAWFVSGALMKPFGAGKGDAGLEGLQLRDGFGADQAVQDELAHHGRHAVISEPAGVDGGGNKAVPRVCMGRRGVIITVSPKS